MMNRHEEFQRVSEIAHSDTPEGHIVRIKLTAETGMEQVLAKIKNILRTLLAYDQTNWPGDNEWSNLLPHWFFSQFRDEPTEDESKQWLMKWKKLSEKQKIKQISDQSELWTLSGWTYWFRPDSTERIWMWWNSKVISQGEGIVEIEVFDWPIAYEAFIHLCKLSGAKKVEIVNMI